jgi:hypothetical protein
MMRVLIIVLLACFYELNNLKAEESIIQKSAKKYIGQEKPSSNKKVNSFKFISYFGESLNKSSKSKSIEKKSDDEFNTIESSLTYIRNKKDKSVATFIGNTGSDEVHVFEGSDSISFMEHVGAGYFQQMVVTDFWDKEKGGFIATYTRVFSFGFGDRFSISTTVYHGIAIPWD